MIFVTYADDPFLSFFLRHYLMFYLTSEFFPHSYIEVHFWKKEKQQNKILN